MYRFEPKIEEPGTYRFNRSLIQTEI